jgi:hypothetical protein
LLAEVVVESHESLEEVRSTVNKQHQYRIRIQVRNIKPKREMYREHCSDVTSSHLQ